LNLSFEDLHCMLQQGSLKGGSWPPVWPV